MNLKKNMGSADRLIRVLVAIVIGVLYYQNIISGTVGLLLLLVAAVFVLTSVVGFCPLYWPFRINTGKSKD
ncbi:MAG: DUF2892 domain-containing protein [Chitinophagales bacterium]|nr:DUF2892 domain-containing protein [Chitinophagales bacterium]MDW8393484.1 DUF2892 domain-containing protein [Chitinophagales bacterium]